MLSLWIWALLLFSLNVVTATAIDCTGINGIKPQGSSPESFYKRDQFFIGGHYVNAAIGHLTYDQMYVEKLTPLSGIRQPYPVVLFHGGGISGAIIAKGSPPCSWTPTTKSTSSTKRASVEARRKTSPATPLRIGSTSNISEIGFSNPQAADAYPQSKLHTQWPGTGVQGDAVFDAFESSFMPLTSNNTRQEVAMRTAGYELLGLIGRSFLLSHSIGAVHPILLSDECPELVAGNVNLEPGNIPFESYVGNATSSVGRTSARPFGLTVTNLNYDPPITNYTDLVTETVGEDTPSNRSCLQQSTAANTTIYTLPNVPKVPYVAFTGQASPHATYDHCVIQYLNQVGVETDWIRMEDLGVYGNAHFGYMELNNKAYFKAVENWISKQANVLGGNKHRSWKA